MFFFAAMQRDLENFPFPHAQSLCGLRQPIESNIGQLNTDRDAFKGSTDTPRGATL